MVYSFDSRIAELYGVDEAVFIHNLYFWISKNIANGHQYRDGKFWTYNTMDAYAKMYKFWTKKQVRRIIENLSGGGAIYIGNYNTKPFDRTQWYALSEDIIRYYQTGEWPHDPCELNGSDDEPNGHMEVTKRAHGSDQTGTPIPDSKPNSKPDINNNNSMGRFRKPTVEEVCAYCRERGNGIDPAYFVDYYDSKGWMIGKSKMKDWKATVRNWERRERNSQNGTRDKASGVAAPGYGDVV